MFFRSRKPPIYCKVCGCALVPREFTPGYPYSPVEFDKDTGVGTRRYKKGLICPNNDDEEHDWENTAWTWGKIYSEPIKSKCDD